MGQMGTGDQNNTASEAFQCLLAQNSGDTKVLHLGCQALSPNRNKCVWVPDTAETWALGAPPKPAAIGNCLSPFAERKTQTYHLGHAGRCSLGAE